MKNDWERKRNKVKFLTLAAALLISMQAGRIGEAAAPEEQLSLIAEQHAVWGSGELFTESVRDGDLVAVTDLDGNGRLELFFLKFVRNPVPHANDKGTNEEKGRALVATVPVTMRPRGYEVSADGKQMEELSFRYSNAIIPPNLTELGEAFYNATDKTRIYKLTTLNRVGELGFRLYRQSMSLQKGTVTVQTLGTEVGGYGLFSVIFFLSVVFHLKTKYFPAFLQHGPQFILRRRRVSQLFRGNPSCLHCRRHHSRKF